MVNNQFFICVIITLLACPILQAQESTFQLTASPDTVYLGNYTMIKLTATNLNGQSKEPIWDPSFKVGVANYASQTQIADGQTTQTISQSYQVYPSKEGTYPIEASYQLNNGDAIETTITLVVKKNPDGIIQNEKISPGSLFDAPIEIPKRKFNKKRKITRL